MAAAQDVSPELLANLGLHNAADIEALRGFVGRPLGIMPRRSTRGTLGRYPAMEKAGLEAVPTVNNGNCFFAAISDQLHGDDSHTAEYRALAVKYILDKKQDFMPFFAVKRGGGTREVAKRKNAGGYSVSVDHGPASEEAKELQFNTRMTAMAKDRTYAEQHEIWALATVLGINIRIFEPATTRDTDETPGNGKPVAAIAYDPVGEHYSSVRRVGVPRPGPGLIEGTYTPPATNSVEESLPPQSPGKPLFSPTELLHPEQWARSRSSTPGSVSVQREDDDNVSAQHAPKRTASGRKIRTPSSRKPSGLSRKISAAPTPPIITSRAPSPSPEAVIVVDALAATSEPETSKIKTEAAKDKTPSAAVTLPSPPYTQSRSPSVVVVSSDDAEADELPISPRKKAQRRRSSKRDDQEKTAMLSAESNSEKVKKASKKGGVKKSKSAELTTELTKSKTDIKRLKRGTKERAQQSSITAKD